MKTSEAVLPQPLPSYNTTTADLAGGFNTYVSAEKIADGECPDMGNLILTKEGLWCDSGYGTFGNRIGGVPQGSCGMQSSVGTSFNLLISTTSAYVWDHTAKQWTYASYSAPTTTTAAAAVGASSLTLASMTGIVLNTGLAVMGTNGEWQFVTAGTPSGLTVPISPALTQAVASGASVTSAIVLHGAQPYWVNFVPWPANNWMIFSNGVDPVMYYDGTQLHVLPGLPANTTARSMALYHEQLLLGNLVENGTNYPYRVRSSDQGDPTNWSTGISALVDLLDTDDEIYHLELLGPWCVIYRARSIMRISYLGLPLQNLFFEYMIGGGRTEDVEAAVGYGAVTSCGDFHVFIGHDNVYSYRGDYNYTPVGHKVRMSFLAPFGKLNEAQKKLAWCFFFETTSEVWVFLPTVNSTVTDTTLRYRTDLDTWCVRTFANPMGGYGMFSDDEGIPWEEGVGTWAAQTFTWTAQGVGDKSEYPLLMDASNPIIYGYDFISTTDAGAVIPWYFVTKAYGQETFKHRLDRLMLFGQGTGISVSYRLSLDDTWHAMGTNSFGGQGVRQSWWQQTVYDYVQFMVQGQDPFSKVNWLTLFSLPEGEW